jgi:hypothetical protein
LRSETMPMQTHHLQNPKGVGVESLILNAQNQDTPKRPIQKATVPDDKVSQFIIVLSGGIAWGTMLAGFNGACVGAALAVVVSYLMTRKH